MDFFLQDMDDETMIKMGLGRLQAQPYREGEKDAEKSDDAGDRSMKEIPKPLNSTISSNAIVEA